MIIFTVFFKSQNCNLKKTTIFVTVIGCSTIFKPLALSISRPDKTLISPLNEFLPNVSFNFLKFVCSFKFYEDGSMTFWQSTGSIQKRLVSRRSLLWRKSQIRWIWGMKKQFLVRFIKLRHSEYTYVPLQSQKNFPSSIVDVDFTSNILINSFFDRTGKNQLIEVISLSKVANTLIQRKCRKNKSYNI